MATKANIIAEIGLVFSRFRYVYNVWTISVTHDPERRKQEWNYPTLWHQWEADSLSDAQGIERHYIKKGMKGVTTDDLSARKPVYVYIF